MRARFLTAGAVLTLMAIIFLFDETNHNEDRKSITPNADIIYTYDRSPSFGWRSNTQPISFTYWYDTEERCFPNRIDQFRILPTAKIGPKSLQDPYYLVDIMTKPLTKANCHGLVWINASYINWLAARSSATRLPDGPPEAQ